MSREDFPSNLEQPVFQDRESRLAREPEAVRAERSQIERPERVGSHPSPAPSPQVSCLVKVLNFYLMLFPPQSSGAVAPTSIGEESGRSKTRDRPANLNPSWDLSTSEDAYVGHFPNDLSLS